MPSSWLVPAFYGGLLPRSPRRGLNSDLNLVALGVRAEGEIGRDLGVDFVFAKNGFVLAETELPSAKPRRQ